MAFGCMMEKRGIFIKMSHSASIYVTFIVVIVLCDPAGRYCGHEGLEIYLRNSCNLIKLMSVHIMFVTSFCRKKKEYRAIVMDAPLDN